MVVSRTSSFPLSFSSGPYTVKPLSYRSPSSYSKVEGRLDAFIPHPKPSISFGTSVLNTFQQPRAEQLSGQRVRILTAPLIHLSERILTGLEVLQLLDELQTQPKYLSAVSPRRDTSLQGVSIKTLHAVINDGQSPNLSMDIATAVRQLWQAGFMTRLDIQQVLFPMITQDGRLAAIPKGGVQSEIWRVKDSAVAYLPHRASTISRTLQAKLKAILHPHIPPATLQDPRLNQLAALLQGSSTGQTGWDILQNVQLLTSKTVWPLRLFSGGVQTSDLLETLGQKEEEALKANLSQLAQAGLLNPRGPSSWSLTRKGRQVLRGADSLSALEAKPEDMIQVLDAQIQAIQSWKASQEKELEYINELHQINQHQTHLLKDRAEKLLQEAKNLETESEALEALPQKGTLLSRAKARRSEAQQLQPRIYEQHNLTRILETLYRSARLMTDAHQEYCQQTEERLEAAKLKLQRQNNVQLIQSLLEQRNEVPHVLSSVMLQQFQGLLSALAEDTSQLDQTEIMQKAELQLKADALLQKMAEENQQVPLKTQHLHKE